MSRKLRLKNVKEHKAEVEEDRCKEHLFRLLIFEFVPVGHVSHPAFVLYLNWSSDS